MSLSPDQFGVLRGIIIGAVAALAILLLGIKFNPFGYASDMTLEDRLRVTFTYLIIPAGFLALSIGRLAKHRFLSAKDIHGSGLSVASDSAMLLQAFIQNTLEQAVLAMFAYLVWAVTMPSEWLSVVPLSAIAFGIGRIIFFTGYKNGAPGRVLGFTLCFFMSVVILITAVGSNVLSVS